MMKKKQHEADGWVGWITATDEPDNFQEVFDRQLRSRKAGIEINLAGTSPAQFAEGLKAMQKLKVSGLPEWLRSATITTVDGKPLTLTVAAACEMALNTHAAAVERWLRLVETTNRKRTAR
jgi:hypothetical protein